MLPGVGAGQQGSGAGGCEIGGGMVVMEHGRLFRELFHVRAGFTGISVKGEVVRGQRVEDQQHDVGGCAHLELSDR